MLTATISRDVLEALVAPLTTFEGNELLHVEPDGIEIHATDKSREAIVDVTASKAIFNTYCAEEMKSGIDLSKVDKFLTAVDGTDLIRIKINIEQGRVTLTADTLSYTFSLVASDDVPCAFDSLDAEQPAAVAIPSRKLDVPIELADMAGSRIRLRVDSDSTTFSGITDDMRDTVSFKFGVADVEQLQRSAVGIPISLDYFAPIQRVIPVDAPMRFELGNREHVRFQYPIADGAGTVTATFVGLVI